MVRREAGRCSDVCYRLFVCPTRCSTSILTRSFRCTRYALGLHSSFCGGIMRQGLLQNAAESLPADAMCLWIISSVTQVFCHIDVVQLINPGQVYSAGVSGFSTSAPILIITVLVTTFVCEWTKHVLLSIWVELLANTCCISSLGFLFFPAAPLTKPTWEVLERSLGCGS